MSAGWGDVYIASLFGQWIVLAAPCCRTAPSNPIDRRPDSKLTELSDFNNVGHTYFNVLNGRVSTKAAPPFVASSRSG